MVSEEVAEGAGDREGRGEGHVWGEGRGRQ